MSEATEEKTGYIAKVIPSKRNPDWFGFVFQGDKDMMFSITLNERVPPDLTSTIQGIRPKDHLTFYYIPNSGEDGKVYNNIHGVEFLEDINKDKPSAESPREKPTYTDGAELGMERCNATNNATLILIKMMEVKGDIEELGGEKWQVFADLIYAWHQAKRYE